MMSNLITIKSFSNQIDAELAKGFLASKGISSTVKVSALGGIIFGQTSADLLVSEGAAELAKKCLDEFPEKNMLLSKPARITLLILMFLSVIIYFVTTFKLGLKH